MLLSEKPVITAPLFSNSSKALAPVEDAPNNIISLFLKSFISAPSILIYILILPGCYLIIQHNIYYVVTSILCII